MWYYNQFFQMRWNVKLQELAQSKRHTINTCTDFTRIFEVARNRVIDKIKRQKNIGKNYMVYCKCTYENVHISFSAKRQEWDTRLHDDSNIKTVLRRCITYGNGICHTIIKWKFINYVACATARLSPGHMKS